MNTTKIKEERSAFYLPNRGVELEDGGHIDYLSKEQSELSAGKNEILLYAYFNIAGFKPGLAKFYKRVHYRL